MKSFVALIAAAALAAVAPSSSAQQPPPLVIKPLAEKKVAEIPPGPLFWRIERFATLAEAQAAAGPLTLVAESAGKAWSFTLGSADVAPRGGTPVAMVGPIARVAAPSYLLRINEASGPPGSVTSVHTHPGSEAFLVLQGEQTMRSAGGTLRIKVGEPMAGHGADQPMQVSSSGTADLHALVMFVVDATRPFSSPAAFP